MNIDEMEAGRELDALVWRALNGQSIAEGTFGCRYVDGDVQPHAGYPVGHISPPHYSTDIAAAMQALEQAMDNGIGLPEISHDGQLWVVAIRDNMKTGTPASGESLSLAISRALVKAVTE